MQVMTPMVEEGALHFDREDPGYGGDEDDDGWSSSPSSPSSPPPAVTPTFNESYTNLKRNLSVKSLRELELKQIQKGLWRRKDEPRKHPRNMDQLLVYATTAGARELGWHLDCIAVSRSAVGLLAVPRWLPSERGSKTLTADPSYSPIRMANDAIHGSRRGPSLYCPHHLHLFLSLSLSLLPPSLPLSRRLHPRLLRQSRGEPRRYPHPASPAKVGDGVR